MTFEGQYLTYHEYTDLGGAQMEETPFNLLEYEARKQIDLRTLNRLVNVDEIPFEVKICMFNLIDKIKTYATTIQNASGNVASESTDGYSITYLTAKEIKEVVTSKNAELQDIILHDLFGVTVNNEHILYPGVA